MPLQSTIFIIICFRIQLIFSAIIEKVSGSGLVEKNSDKITKICMKYEEP